MATALVGNPKILFLDEPTTGLDPQSRRQLWEIVRQFQQRNGTVLLTTHYMDEAERLCDRLAIIDHGQIIAAGTPAELIAAAQRTPRGRVCDLRRQRRRATASGARLPGVQSVRHEDGLFSLAGKRAARDHSGAAGGGAASRVRNLITSPRGRPAWKMFSCSSPAGICGRIDGDTGTSTESRLQTQQEPMPAGDQRTLGGLPTPAQIAHEGAVARARGHLLGIRVSAAAGAWAWGSRFAISRPT